MRIALVPELTPEPMRPDRSGHTLRPVTVANGHEPSDVHLVRRVVDGDRTALGGLYDRWGRHSYSLARRICGDDELGEDVVQEVFLAFWRAPRRFDPQRGSFASWLLTIVHHKAVDAVRRERVFRRYSTPAAHDGEWRAPSMQGADEAALCALAAGEVRTALAQLPAEQRRVLALTYFGGYTQREVADIVEVPLGTVKSRTFTGIKRLRGILGPLLGDVVADTTAEGARHDR